MFVWLQGLSVIVNSIRWDSLTDFYFLYVAHAIVCVINLLDIKYSKYIVYKVYTITIYHDIIEIILL